MVKDILRQSAKSDFSGYSFLIAEDSEIDRKILEHNLANTGCHPKVARSVEELLNLVQPTDSICFLDLNLPDMSGKEALEVLNDIAPELVVIIISGATLEDALDCMRMGAFWYIQKPLDPHHFHVVLNKALEHRRILESNREVTAVLSQPITSRGLAGPLLLGSDQKSRLERILNVDSNILLLGESGTGKTTLARYILENSHRSRGPFVSISCASLPRELIESELFGHEKGACTWANSSRPGHAELADGGTLFLDEIGELPLELQPKLLTFLQDKTVTRLGGTKTKRVNIRIITATLKDLREQCEMKLFRQDLYFRLNVMSLTLPPLRDRVEVIPKIVSSLLIPLGERTNKSGLTVSPAALKKLMRYPWPGNIRELENTLEQSAILCDGNTDRRATNNI